MIKLTKAQQVSLCRLWQRNNNGMSYLQFRRTIMPGHDYIGVIWCNMFIGIELDGYTHS